MAVPMHTGTELGARLRSVRQERGLSVRELARHLDRSPSLISQFERGVTAPSAGVLYQLATALDTSLDFLFGVEPQQSRPALAAIGGVTVTRRPSGGASRQPLAPLEDDTGDLVQRVSGRQCLELASGVRWERLTPSRDPYVDFLEVIYQPLGNAEGPRQLTRHDGREYGMVLTGSLRAMVGFDEYELTAGDSLAFDSATPHVYWNPTDSIVRTISLIVHHEAGRA